MGKKRKSRGQDIPANEGRGRSIKGPQMNDTFKERVSGEEAEFSTTRSGLKREGKELRNLGADMLGEVFSFLTQRELFGVMSVSKDWEKAVIEGSGLWRKVDVCRKWNLGGEGRNVKENTILRRVIGFAEDVTFSRAFERDDKHVFSVGGWLAPNLRILRLPSECVLPTFFPTLVSMCPLLESLVIKGNVALGNDPVHIQHPNLKSLKFHNCLSFVLSINCPALTHLSTLSELDYMGRGIRDSDTPCAPSLFCARLKSLCLSRFHCAKGVLEAVATHAPNITSLEAYVTEESPFTVLTRFKALHALKVRECNGGGAIISRAIISSWPLLENLRLKGNDFADDIEVAHAGLKSLDIWDKNGVVSPILSCISLEHLKLSGEIFEARCLKNLDQSCPMLKRVEIGRNLGIDDFDDWIDEDEADAPLEIFHGRLEELELRSITRSSVRVACTNLEKLVLKWGLFVNSEFRWALRFPTIECPRLNILELYYYDHMLSSIPDILSVLPCLESLRCVCLLEDSVMVVLEHQNLRFLVVTTPTRTYEFRSEFKLKMLGLNMPSLVQVEVVDSIQRVRVVSSSQEAVVKFTPRLTSVGRNGMSGNMEWDW